MIRNDGQGQIVQTHYLSDKQTHGMGCIRSLSTQYKVCYLGEAINDYENRVIVSSYLWEAQDKIITQITPRSGRNRESIQVGVGGEWFGILTSATIVDCTFHILAKRGLLSQIKGFIMPMVPSGTTSMQFMQEVVSKG